MKSHANSEDKPTANPTHILGIDIGYSLKRKTCCSCALSLEGRTILLKEKPNRFSFPDTLHELERLREIGVYPSVVGVDAPLTPRLIEEKPSTGRAVDKLFSRGEFSNGRRGPQPGSIATPRQGWPLYRAGMTFISLLREVFPRNQYIELSEAKRTKWHGAIEVFPKLTQAVLLPRSSIAERPRRANIDEHLFPQLFMRHQDIIRRTLRGFAIDTTATDFIDEVSARPATHHEELAAFVAAFQGLLCFLGSASAIGHAGDLEGYFALPRREFWHKDWRKAYKAIDRDDCIEVAIEKQYVPPKNYDPRSFG